MSMDKPFRVEVTVDAPRDEVWRALTEPEQIKHWFGWQYDGLDDEITWIFSSTPSASRPTGSRCPRTAGSSSSRTATRP